MLKHFLQTAQQHSSDLVLVIVTTDGPHKNFVEIKEHTCGVLSKKQGAKPISPFVQPCAPSFCGTSVLRSISRNYYEALDFLVLFDQAKSTGNVDVTRLAQPEL